MIGTMINPIFLILILRNIILSNTILIPSKICSSQFNGLTNMNDVLQLSPSRASRFLSLLNLTSNGNYVTWHINSYASWIYANASYESGISNQTYQDLNLALRIFRTELYVDVELAIYIPILMCGQPFGKDSPLFRVGGMREVCKLVANFQISYPPNIYKVRFSKTLGQNIKVYVYSDEYILLYTFYNTSKMVLSKIVFLHNHLTNFSRDLKGPKFHANFHECQDYGKNLSTIPAVLWPTKLSYDSKRLLHSIHYICDTVEEKGIYNLVYWDGLSNTNRIIPEVKLVQRLDNTNHGTKPYKGIYLELHGYFKVHIWDNMQNCVLFKENITGIGDAFPSKPLNIIALNEFTINMTQYINGQCYVTVQNFVTGTIEKHLFYSHEKISLTQSRNGILGFAKSKLYSTTPLEYPNSYILKVVCDTVVKVENPVFEISPFPLFWMERELVECPI